MIVYLDSSVLVRAYLADEVDHSNALELLEDPNIAAITGSWTLIETSGALVRPARAGRADEKALLSLLDADLSDEGPVTVVSPPQGIIEDKTLYFVRKYSLRAMDAWHIAVAELVLPTLIEPGEEALFASRDQQRLKLQSLGFRCIWPRNLNGATNKIDFSFLKELLGR